MIISIDKNHPIFNSDDYKKDIVPFQLMELIKQFPMLLVTNEKDFIVGMTSPKMPIWVWTTDSIEETSKSELCEYFYKQFYDYKDFKFVAKPDIAKLLSTPFEENLKAIKSIIKMQSFENRKVIPAKNQSVKIERPTENDLEALSVCAYNFQIECFNMNTETISVSDFLESAKKLLNNPYCFVIKENSIVVAVAQSSRENDSHIAINHVYTMPEHRKKGYASAIVAHISELILKKGKIPTLYTDLSNPSSNQAYKNVGFVEQAPVDEISLKWD